MHGCGCGQTGVGAEPRSEGIVCVYVCVYVREYVIVCVCLCVYLITAVA